METMTYFYMVLKVAVCTDVFPLDLTEILKGKAEFCALSGSPTFALEENSKNSLCVLVRNHYTCIGTRHKILLSQSPFLLFNPHEQLSTAQYIHVVCASVSKGCSDHSARFLRLAPFSTEL